MKTAEVAAVFHFLGKNIVTIVFAGNMKNLESFAMYPFTNSIFVEFNVADTFCGEIICPVYA